MSADSSFTSLLKMNNRVIAITGFMAAGKTTVGRALAALLECAFVDLDEQIVARDGREISAIIEADGEAAFRSMETEVLEKVLQADEPCVVALGGGTWTIAANRTVLQRAGADVVWLDVPFALCWSRIKQAGGTRPLASSQSAAEDLYRERWGSYELANHRIKLEQGMTAVQCAEAISGALFPQ